MAKVLICSEDHFDNQFLEELLSTEGYEVEVTHQASEAIRRILTQRFQALILGIHLEGMSGLEAIPIINKIDSRLPIITITDDDSLETERKTRKERIFYYFLKPVDAEEIKAVLRDAIQKHRGAELKSGKNLAM